MIEKYNGQLFEQFKFLFKNNYRNNKLIQKKEYIDWQFSQNPFSLEHGHTLYCYYINGRITGHIGYIPALLMMKEETHRAILPVNWWSENGMAGLSLLEYIQDKSSYILQYGISLEAKKIYSLFNIPILNSMPRSIIATNPDVIERLFKISTIKAKQIIKKSYQQINRYHSNIPIKDIKRFDQNHFLDLGFWKTVKNFVIRDGLYLNWRYIDIPFHDYKVITNNLIGQYLIYRIEKISNHPFSVIKILEWSIYNHVESVLSFLFDIANKSNSIIIDFFCTSKEILNFLGDYAFFSHEALFPDTLPYLFRPIHYSEPIVLGIDTPPHRKKRSIDFNEWYITKGDGDMDRKK